MKIQLMKNSAELIVETKGAEARAYRTPDGRQRLWSGDESVWKGVAPILFPFVGRVKDDQVRFGGKAYAMPKHGFARDTEFEVLRQGDDFVSLGIRDSAQTREVYPFAFALTVTYRMLDNGFQTECRVENYGKQTMPFTLGGHPGFACPMNEGERFDEYEILFETAEEGDCLRCSPRGLMDGSERVALSDNGHTLALRYELFDEKDTLIFAGLRSRSVELRHRKTGKGMRLSFPQSDTLAVWTMPGKHAPYVCLEPWNGVPAFEEETGDFEDKPYHVELCAGESWRMEFVAEFE